MNTCGLEPEDVYYRSDPTSNLRQNGATQEEIVFLRGDGGARHGYQGQRVELNAFASGDLIAWIESKLQQHGVKADTIQAAARVAAIIKAVATVHATL